MKGKRYSEEFKIEAVKQVVELGHSVSSVAAQFDITTRSLYDWIKIYDTTTSTNKAQAEIRNLKKELKRVTAERNMLEKAVSHFAKLTS